MSFLVTLLVLGAMGLFLAAKGCEPGKTRTLLWSCFAGCILLFLIIMFTTMAQHPYNPESKYKQEREDQWIQDNFGDGKGQEIQDAIDNYKNGQ